MLRRSCTWLGPDYDARGIRLEVLRETCAHRVSLCATLFAEWLHERPDSPELSRALAAARWIEALRAALDPERLALRVSLFSPPRPGPRPDSAS